MSTVRDQETIKHRETAQNIFQRTSSSHKKTIIACSLMIAAVLGWLLLVSQPRSLTGQKMSADQQLISHLTPQEEITPEYIQSISQPPRQKEHDKAEEAAKKKEEKRIPTEEAVAPRVSSMILYGSASFSRQLGSLGIPMGTEVQAVLEKTVIADDRSVPVIARIARDVVRDGKLLIPQDARLFGQTQGMVENRIHVKFERVVFPDGKEHPFSGIALDRNGSGGIPGKLKQKHARRGLGVLSQAAIGASSVFSPMGRSFTESTLRGAQQGASNEAARDWNYYRQTEAMPTVTLHAQTAFIVLIDQQV